MGKIIIDRENNYLGAAANYNIYLDGNKIDSINNGGVEEYIVASGKHSLYVQNGLLSFGLKSNILEFDISDSTEIRILCKSTMTKWSGIELEIVSNNNISSQNNIDKYDQLQKLNNLKQKNIITENEYEIEKEKILKGD